MKFTVAMLLHFTCPLKPSWRLGPPVHSQAMLLTGILFRDVGLGWLIRSQFARFFSRISNLSSDVFLRRRRSLLRESCTFVLFTDVLIYFLHLSAYVS